MSSDTAPKNLVILGATGSIGKTTLNLVRSYPERFKIIGLTANRSHEKLLQYCNEFQPKFVHLMDKEAARSAEFAFKANNFSINTEMDSLLEFLTNCQADLVIAGMVGNIGLMPVLKSLESGLSVALANKETLVSAGHLATELVKSNHSASILPVDSEHSAIFQCLQAQHKSFRKLILTASGGRFRTSSIEEIRNASVEKALTHPNWDMGAKITIDSSTLMNKGLEVIEAKWLFDCPIDTIDVVVHPQSIIHSMVEFEDRSVLAQLGWPDMTIPIHYALTYPERMNLDQLPPLDLVKIGQLNFESPDKKRFPCLNLAYEAGRLGDSYPAALNAANEVAVAAFIDKKISFLGIPKTIEWCLERHESIHNPSLDEVLEVDNHSRESCQSYINEQVGKL